MFRLRLLVYVVVIQSIGTNLQPTVLEICDLCCPSSNSSMKIDSIAYITDENKYFFTMNGHYWLLDQNEEFPSKVFGRELPGGFKTGEAAFYLDTSKGCAQRSTKRQREIHLFEKTKNGMQVMILDIDANKWYRNPISYKLDKVVSSAPINSNQTVDTIFTFRDTNVVIVMANNYFVMNTKGLCDTSNDLKQKLSPQPNSDLASNKQNQQMDAITMINDTFGLIFKELNFWLFEVKSFKGEKFDRVVTYAKRNVIEDFFKIEHEKETPGEQIQWFCERSKDDPPTGNYYLVDTTPTPPPPSVSSLATLESDPGKKEIGTPTNDTPEHVSQTWIVIGLAIVIVIVIGVALLSFLTLRKRREKKAQPDPQLVAANKKSKTQKWKPKT